MSWTVLEVMKKCAKFTLLVNQIVKSMYSRLLGIAIAAFGLYLIYAKRHLQDDSLLLGTVLILAGVLMFTIGWITRMDGKRK